MRKNSRSLYRSVSRWIKKQLRNPRKRLIIEAVAAIAGIGIILSLVFSGSKTSTDDLKAGISYIKSLEETDTTEIEKQIKEIKKAERKEALESGEVDVWQQFDDSVIMGDSRAVGFSYHEFVEESRVLATGGATIRDIAQYFDQLKTINPSTIFLCYGLNDISIGYWDTAKDYIKELDDILAQLNKELPDATVFVNSTIPAIDPAFERSKKWKNIPDWNAEIKAHCEDEQIPYIDISDTVEENKSLYDPDGIHMRKDFYEIWAIDMVTEVNDYE